MIENDIIIGFSRSISFWKIGSRVIQEVEKRNYSHVYIRYVDPSTGIVMIAQASHGMINEMSFAIFKQNNIIVKEYNLTATEKQFLDILIFIKQNLGKSYSMSQIFLIGIKKLFGFETTINNKDTAFICSELGARICIILGIILNNNIDYETPSDLDTLLQNTNTPLLS